MGALNKQRRFEALRTVLGLVEERGSAPLAECAAAAGVDEETMRDVLAAALYVDYYDAGGHLVSESGAFLLDEHGVLSLQEGHWLRDLAAMPPSPDDALRLLLAGLAMQAVAERPTPDLDGAVAKLRGVVACDLRMDVARPPALATVHEAIEAKRSLRVRYLREGADTPTERELLPYKVWSRWGNWYLTARDINEADAKQFRVDRMLDPAVGPTPFDPPTDVELPDWFDLAEHERTVRLRMRADRLEGLPAPHRLGEPTDVGGGRVELDVTVSGDHRLDHLLLCLEPDDEVVAPLEYAQRRRARAQELLEVYGSSV
jgi:predicted DNA-binding transcriptional regulator YafY